MIRALDCSTPTTPHIPAIVKAGVKTVIRYVGHPASGADLTQSEAKALLAHGLGIGLVYEGSASWMLGGHAAGIEAANAAKSHIRALGGPDHPFVYFAADFDASAAQTDAVMQCLAGAAQVLGKNYVGVYGGLRVVTTALQDGRAYRAWQTVAWSGGTWNPHAVLRQILGSPWGALGFSYDADEQLAANVGQWGYVAPKPVVVDYRPLKVPAVALADELHIPHAGVDVTVEAKGTPFEVLLLDIAKSRPAKVDYRPTKAAAVRIANELKIAHHGVVAGTNALGTPARNLLREIAKHK